MFFAFFETSKFTVSSFHFNSGPPESFRKTKFPYVNDEQFWFKTKINWNTNLSSQKKLDERSSTRFS
jgi:hypothetical protein